MSLLSRVVGVVGNLFRLGIGGPQLKNNSGVVEVRNATDAGFAELRATTIPFTPSVVATSLTNISLAVPDWTASSWDGITVSVGARILLSQQTASAENGIYIRPGAGALARAADSIVSGTRVYVETGEIYAGCSFVQETTGAIVLGVSPLVWACLDGPRKATPLTSLVASGAGAWVTLATVVGPPADGYDLVMVVDNVATKSDGSIIARSRGPTTYRRASGSVVLSDDSRYLTAATFLQQVASGNNVLLQGWQQAAGSGDYTFRIRVWYEYVRAL